MRKKIDLNFNWYFSKFIDNHLTDYKSIINFKSVNIPHTMQEIDYNYVNPKDTIMIGTYRKTLEIKEEYKNKIVKLVFEGVAHSAQIFINGEYVSSHQGGYDRFIVNITRFINFNDTNFLTVIVNSNENKDIPPFGGIVDYLGYGGIYREVSLLIHDIDYIDASYIRTLDLESKIICGTVYTSKDSGQILLEIFDNNKIVLTEKFDILNQSTNFDLQFNELEKWSLDNPKLYNIRLNYLINNEIVDVVDYKTGFREVEFKVDGFYLNGEKIKLRGLNRHQSYPYVGYAMPKSVQEKDADILKYDLGVNIVRTSHYMQSPHFLNRCDEIGLLVFEEIPGWQHIGEELFKTNTMNNLKAMIDRDYQHPSIIMWGVRINESFDSDLYINTNSYAHKYDSSRPTGGVRNFKKSKMYEDVYTYNDFSYSGGKKIIEKPSRVKKNVPYLVTEFNGHMFPTKRFDTEQRIIEHALRHYRVLNESYKYAQLSGVIGWCMCDYNTHLEFGSGDAICYHGVLDMYRIPKYASSIYSSQRNNGITMDILSTLNPGDYDASLLNKIYIATNCDYVKVYKDSQLVGTYCKDKTSKLEHPLIIIDDLIGNLLIENEKFSKLNSKIAKTIFKKVSKYGNNLPLIHKLMMLYLLWKNRLNLNAGIKLFYKYSSMNNDFSFEGIVNDQVVIKKTISKFKEYHYDIKLDTNTLYHDTTYDAVRIVVRKLDQNDMLLRYAFDNMKISVGEGLELIGPDNISLLGGAIAFWVKSTKKDIESEIKVAFNDKELIEKVYIK